MPTRLARLMASVSRRASTQTRLGAASNLIGGRFHESLPVIVIAMQSITEIILSRRPNHNCVRIGTDAAGLDFDKTLRRTTQTEIGAYGRAELGVASE